IPRVLRSRDNTRPRMICTSPCGSSPIFLSTTSPSTYSQSGPSKLVRRYSSTGTSVLVLIDALPALWQTINLSGMRRANRAVQCGELKLEVDFSREVDGRWIADIPALPGVTAYGCARREALGAVEALALRVIADRIEHGEATPGEMILKFAI